MAIDLGLVETEIDYAIGAEHTETVMAIIRRAVSPSAPEGLRARIAEALADMDNALTGPTRYHRICADAVLAVLPPAPRVDVDAVTLPRDLAERASEQLKRFADALDSRGQHALAADHRTNANAIRARLEGTA